MPADLGSWISADAAAEHLSAIVRSSDDAILSKDEDGIILSWNPAAERMYGYSAEEAIGQPISILIPSHRAGEERKILEQVFSGKPLEHYETERVTKYGQQLNVSLSVSPVRDADGKIVAAAVIARDVTRRTRTLMLASRLQEVTGLLARETTVDGVIQVVLDQVVEGLGADAGAVGLVEGDEVTLSGAVGYSTEGLSGWQQFPLGADLPMSSVIRSGEPLWTTSAEELTKRFPALTEAPVRFAALAVLPLSAGEAPYGAVSLSFATRTEFDPEERAFLVAVTQQAGYALGRARSHEAERLAGARQAFLGEAGELLTRSLDPDETLQQFASLAVTHIADWCGVEVLDDNGNLRSVAVAHVDEDKVRLARELRERYPQDPEAPTGVPNVIRTGVTELYSEIPDEMLVEAAQDEEHLKVLREVGLNSAMIVPLRARGRVFGAISYVASDPERRYDEDDVALAEDLSRRAALAIDNAMMFRREHEAALILQRSLLPESVPREHDGMEFDVRYWPAAPELEVGGDWYEVVLVDDGTVAVTIGDVAGRGIRAASMMGRVRPALRAYVLDGHRPQDAMTRLDRLMREYEPPEMTTVFHLHYDPGKRRASYVRAGHPPALMRTPDGEIAELAGTGTPPLGILEEVHCVEHEIEIPAGSLLLLYTDGLIERRDSDLTEGLERLKDVFREAPASASDCLDWIDKHFETDSIPDDVATLAMAVR